MGLGFGTVSRILGFDTRTFVHFLPKGSRPDSLLEAMVVYSRIGALASEPPSPMTVGQMRHRQHQRNSGIAEALESLTFEARNSPAAVNPKPGSPSLLSENDLKP